MFFQYSLFYYFNNTIEIDARFIPGYNPLNFSASLVKSEFIKNNILRYSMIARCLIPVILICFILLVCFIVKHINKHRRYIYPITFILFLFIIEFIVLSFFDYCLPYVKYFRECGLYTIHPYIHIFHPSNILSIIICWILVLCGSIVDDSKFFENISWYKIIIKIFIALVVAILIGMVTSVVINLLSSVI